VNILHILHLISYVFCHLITKLTKSCIILEEYLQYVCAFCDLSHTQIPETATVKSFSLLITGISHKRKTKSGLTFLNWLKDSKTTCHTLLHKVLQNGNYKSAAHTIYQPWSKGTTGVDAPKNKHQCSIKCYVQG
jgi:hypothetical protein